MLKSFLKSIDWNEWRIPPIKPDESRFATLRMFGTKQLPKQGHLPSFLFRTFTTQKIPWLETDRTRPVQLSLPLAALLLLDGVTQNIDYGEEEAVSCWRPDCLLAWMFSNYTVKRLDLRERERGVFELHKKLFSSHARSLPIKFKRNSKITRA